VAAVDRLDLTVDRGVLYGFLGPNGAGKTTTIRMLLRLILPTDGRVDLLGVPVAPGRDTDAALRRVGAMVEEPAFWKFLSGRRNLRYLAMAAGPAEDRDARVARVDEVLALVGLEAAADKKVKAYSQGMRQRLGIALALLGDPELLILDEPTNGLDPQGMREVRTLLRSLADRGTTIFVSSHLLSEVEAMCDRVGVLARGRLVAEGPPHQLRRASGRVRLDVDDVRRAGELLAGMDGVTVLDEPVSAGPGVPVRPDRDLRPSWGPDAGAGPDRTGEAEHRPGSLRIRLGPTANPASVNAALVRGGVGVGALVPEQDSLEDVFLSLVEGADVPR
jgi:ABC-2 type transport system ATP-binding protein